MRFTLAQLLKLSMPYHFSEMMDLKEDLIGLESIIDLDLVKVEGTINRIDQENYRIKFDIKTNLVMECAITLKPVNYLLDVTCEELFSTAEDDSTFKIDGQTLDTKEAVITNILVNKPINVFADDVDVSVEHEDITEVDEENDSINPAFRALKDLL